MPPCVRQSAPQPVWIGSSHAGSPSSDLRTSPSYALCSVCFLSAFQRDA